MDKEEINKSVEVRSYRANAILMLSTYAFLILVFTLIPLLSGLSYPQDLYFVLAMDGLLTVCFLPFGVFYLVRWLQPLIHAEDYRKQEVAFNNSETLLRGMSYFSFPLSLDGKTVEKDTHAFFIEGSWGFQRYASITYFAHSRVEVAYDSKHDRVLVLRSLDPEAEQVD